jgi:hypothetical protein
MQTADTRLLWFLASGFFYLEDEGDTFLRNVGTHKINTPPHPRKRHSTYYEVPHCVIFSFFPNTFSCVLKPRSSPRERQRERERFYNHAEQVKLHLHVFVDKETAVATLVIGVSNGSKSGNAYRVLVEKLEGK